MAGTLHHAQERIAARYVAIDALRRAYWFMPWAPESVRLSIALMRAEIRSGWRVCSDVVWC